VYCVAFAPDGQQLMSGSADRRVCIWSATPGKQLTYLEASDPVDAVRNFAHSGAVHGIAWSPDGRYAVTGSRDRVVSLWDVEQGRLLASLVGHSGKVHAVAFAPDGQRVVSGAHDGTVRVWNTEGGRELAPLCGPTGNVTNVRFVAHGQRILTIAADVSIR